MEVSVHKFVDEVDIVEIVSHMVWRTHDVPQRNNVLVVELPQYLDSLCAQVTMCTIHTQAAGRRSRWIRVMRNTKSRRRTHIYMYAIKHRVSHHLYIRSSFCI